MLLLALIAVLGTTTELFSQNISSHEIVFDTVNISISHHQITADKDIYIGKLKVYDPEGKRLYFNIVFQEFENLFSIDRDGVIWADRWLLLEHCPFYAYTIEIQISDGINITSGAVNINVKCK